MRKFSRTGILLALSLVLSLAAQTSRAAQDPEASPQGQAYRACLKAIDAGDFEAYKKCLTSATAKKMDEQTKGKSSKEVMSFVKSMSPTDLKITGVRVDGKNATLMTTGKMDGMAMKGSIAMMEEGGQWKVGQPSWEPAK